MAIRKFKPITKSTFSPLSILSPTFNPRGAMIYLFSPSAQLPHGGGEGRAPIGRKGPMTPWGKPALGYKTRKKNKASDKLIVSRRKKKQRKDL